jgi:hypothetical protein
MDHRKQILLVATILLFSISSLAYGMPNTINHQGYLTDDGGTPISGPQTVTFRIYDVATGGTHLWEAVMPVDASSGRYSVILGDPPGTPLDPAIFTSQLYLGVQMSGGDAEMDPRTKLSSTPYAIRAVTVEEGGLLFVKDNDVIIGRLISVADNPAGGKIYTLLTSEGYRARLAPVDPTGASLAYQVGDLTTPLVYTDGACTSSAYVEKLLNPGVVICDAANICYYTDTTATQTFITPGSYYDGTCNASASPGGWRLPLIPNDLATTGIPVNGVYAGPISVSAR